MPIPLVRLAFFLNRYSFYGRIIGTKKSLRNYNWDEKIQNFVRQHHTNSGASSSATSGVGAGTIVIRLYNRHDRCEVTVGWLCCTVKPVVL